MTKVTLTKFEEDLLEYKQSYYAGTPIISDEEYDQLEDQLRKVNSDSPVLHFVGHKVTGEKIRHKKPMLSLEKVKTLENLEEWANGEVLIISDKVDGTACSLVYDRGIFKLAKTRGDGIYGEDITNSVRYISFPTLLKDDYESLTDISEVRGEICITKDNFKLLQGDMQKRGLQAPESMRNCVAGLLHRKEHVDLCQYLTFLAYGITQSILNPYFEYEHEIFNFLTESGFSTPEYCTLTDPDHAKTLIDKGPQDQEYLTDGYVFAIDTLKDQLNRGFTSHHPKGKIAFKFQAEKAITTIKNIITDVGRTGKLTFVAEVEPVFLSGATISRLTLHNWKYVKDHNLSNGSKIEITRSNEVIPKHVRTVESDGYLDMPQNCPLCGASVSLSSTGVDLYCKEITCPAKAYGRLEHWVKIVEIDNIGGETLKDLFETEKVRIVSDFYKLTKSDIEELPRMGKRSAKKIFDNIQKTKEVPLDKFLAALGIDGLGRSIARSIGETFLSLDEICRVSLLPTAEFEYAKIEGIGETLSKNIDQGLNSYGFSTAIQLRQAGVTIADMTNPADLILDGKIFVITGSLNKPRKMIQDIIKSKGGKVSSSVSSRTTYLVCNELSGSSKSRKALELNIPIISEEKLMEMVGGKG